MGAVATFFLRAKHWQIFLLLFGIGCVGGTAAMLLDLVTARSPEELLKISLPFGFVMVLFMFCLLAYQDESWRFAVGLRRVFDDSARHINASSETFS
jgi:hypothetical protein